MKALLVKECELKECELFGSCPHGVITDKEIFSTPQHWAVVGRPPPIT